MLGALALGVAGKARVKHLLSRSDPLTLRDEDSCPLRLSKAPLNQRP